MSVPLQKYFLNERHFFCKAEIQWCLGEALEFFIKLARTLQTVIVKSAFLLTSIFLALLNILVLGLVSELINKIVPRIYKINMATSVK
jgi:hypothetical protein